MKPIYQPIRYIILALCLFIPSHLLKAQYYKQPVLDKGSIDSQFISLRNNSSQYEYNGVLYKGIRIDYLTILKTNTSDTLKTLYKRLFVYQQTINKKNAVIDSLSHVLGNTSELYLNTSKEKNSLNFFGITFSKAAYNSLLWTIIFGLIFLLITLALLYKKNNTTNIQTKQDLEDLKKEYEAHRKRALEREEKLARQHLDELNKYKR
jgi:hypothetical protein